MNKKIIATLTALLCTFSSFSAMMATAEEEVNPYLLPVDMGYFYGFIVETDGTELTAEMLPFGSDYQLMWIYTWDYITDKYYWGYLDIDYTPSESTYIVQMRSNKTDYLNNYARQAMLEVDCIEEAYLFEYTMYSYGYAGFNVEDGQEGIFRIEMNDPSAQLEDLDIPEFEGMEFVRYEDLGAIYYNVGDNERDSALYADVVAYVDEASNGELSYPEFYSDIYSYEFLNNYADELAEKYSEYFTIQTQFGYLENELTEPSSITFALPTWQTAGDHNADGETNSNDAAALLVQAAEDGAAEASAGTVSPRSDGDLDGVADASDAAYILQYSALKGAGMDPDWVEILKK